MTAVRRRGRSDRGAVIVEFALIAPFLLMVVFGIVDFGWMIDRSNVINNVTRDAARSASLDGSYSDIKQVVSDEMHDIGITLPSADVNVSITCTNVAPAANCTDSATGYDNNVKSGSAVKVSISYTHHWITPVGALCGFFGGGSCTGNTIQLTRTSEMIRE
jgi:Flp pilus assembly protein TadG